MQLHAYHPIDLCVDLLYIQIENDPIKLKKIKEQVAEYKEGTAFVDLSVEILASVFNADKSLWEKGDVYEFTRSATKQFGFSVNRLSGVDLSLYKDCGDPAQHAALLFLLQFGLKAVDYYRNTK